MAAKSIDGNYLQSNYYKRSLSRRGKVIFRCLSRAPVDDILRSKIRSIRRANTQREKVEPSFQGENVAAERPSKDLRAAKG